MDRTERRNKFTIIAGDFNTPLSVSNSNSRWNTIGDREVLDNNINQMDLIDINRTLHPRQQNTHSFQVHMEYSPIDHILGHKTNLNKF